MNDELGQRIHELRGEIEQLEKQYQQNLQQDGGPVRPVPGISQPGGQSGVQAGAAQRQEAFLRDAGLREGVRRRLIQLRNSSKDPQFSTFLDQLMFDLESSKTDPNRIQSEAERNYHIYLNRIKQQTPINRQEQMNRQVPVTPHVPINPQTPAREDISRPETAKKSRNISGVERTIGVGILSVIGAIFLLIAFITFSQNFLNGLWQGIFLYLVAVVIVLLSELLLERKIPQIARGITGVGIGGAYAVTIFNYTYLESFSGLVAILIAAAITGLAILLGRERDSTAIRLVSLCGCYICFLMVSDFAADLDFLVAAVILFLINTAYVFISNAAKPDLFHSIHTRMNFVFMILLVIFADINYISDINIIFFITLNIAFMNIVYWKQQKNTLNTALFCVELGLSGLLSFLFVSGIAESDYSMDIMIYNRIFALLLTLAVCIFFSILHRGRREKCILYCFFTSFALILMPDSYMAVFLLPLLFIISKIFFNRRELEVMNCIITIFAFIGGIWYYDTWWVWLYVAAAAGSIFLIKRWHLFYEFAISLFILSAILFTSDTYYYFLPASAGALLGLCLLFHYRAGKRNDTAQRRSYELAYNITNISVFAFISLAAVIERFSFTIAQDLLPWCVMLLFGSLYVIFCLTPKFGIRTNKKYLVLAGYLTWMVLFVLPSFSVFKSIPLMLIAIGSIVTGIRIKDRAQRLYGLLLALFVCGKVILYDLNGLSPLQWVIAYFVTGCLILAISIIYIRLEKKQQADLAIMDKRTAEPAFEAPADLKTAEMDTERKEPVHFQG